MKFKVKTFHVNIKTFVLVTNHRHSPSMKRNRYSKPRLMNDDSDDCDDNINDNGDDVPHDLMTVMILLMMMMMML